MDCHLQHPGAVRFLDDDGETRQVVAPGRGRAAAGTDAGGTVSGVRPGVVAGIVGGVEGQGQHGVRAAARGAQRHEGLLRERRIAVGLFSGSDEGPDVPHQLFVDSSLQGEYGPILRVRGTHGARLYVRGPSARGAPVDLMPPALGRIVVKSSGLPAVRGIHHWGGLDTFDPYVLHCNAKGNWRKAKPRTLRVRGFAVSVGCRPKEAAQASVSSSSGCRTSVRR